MQKILEGAATGDKMREKGRERVWTIERFFGTIYLFRARKVDSCSASTSPRQSCCALCCKNCKNWKKYSLTCT